MKLELLASKNYVDGVKARLIAEGGLEEAITELKARSSLDGVSDPKAEWVYADTRYWWPLEDATILRDPTNAADWQNRASFVGSLGSTYARKGDRYRIQCIDAQAQFNLNNVFDGITDGIQVDPATPAQGSRDSNLYCRELRALGAAIQKLNTNAQRLGIDPVKDARYPKDTPKYFGAEAILMFRRSLEGKMFNSKYQLTEILPTQMDYDLLNEYVTTKSWMDPKTVVPINHEGITEAFTDVAVVPPNAGEVPTQRAPININLAPVEVIAANLAGLCGRGVFMHFGPRTKIGAPTQPIDQGAANPNYTFMGKRPQDNSEIMEELDYGSFPVVVYFSPMCYHPGTNQASDPTAQPFVDAAIKVAQMIDQRRRSTPGTGAVGAATGPFRSFADWERWVDQNLTNDLFISLKDASGQNAFPQPGTALIRSWRDHTPLGQAPFPIPTVADIQASPRFAPWFFDCMRSIFKATFNPNARLSALNPNSAVYLDVDKGNLFYLKDPTTPTGTKFNSQTCEWCFGSKGIFEIVSLGEVLGADKVSPGIDPVNNPALDSANPYAQAKILTVVQIFDEVVHTSQRDFEQNGHPPSFTSATVLHGGWGDEKGAPAFPPNPYRFGIVSFPFPRQYWDPRVGPIGNLSAPSDPDRFNAEALGGANEGWHAHDDEGHLELSPKVTLRNKPDKTTDIIATSVVDFGKVLFALFMQDRKVRPDALNPLDPRPYDVFVADVAATQDINNLPGFGQPTTGDPPTDFAMPYPFRYMGDKPVSALGLKPDAAIAGVYDTSLSGPQQMYQLLLNPDGLFTNELRNLPLWYRAGNLASLPKSATYPTDGDDQGVSIPNPTAPNAPANWAGNSYATPKGAIEFWYKPDFDWFIRQKKWTMPGTDPTSTFTAALPGGLGTTVGDASDERFCGYIATTHVALNDAATLWQTLGNQPRPTRGMQMHVTRNTAGDLRVTRLYFEVVGPQTPAAATGGAAQPVSELPWVTDINPAGGPATGKPISVSDYMRNCVTMPQYTWPPIEFQTIPAPWHDIKHARVDAWVPGYLLKQWRAHEWHHIAIRWDDSSVLPLGTLAGGTGTEVVQVLIDGVPVQSVSHQFGEPYQAYINTAVKPYIPPTTAGAPPSPPPTQLEPGFVRLNQQGNSTQNDARRPKDQIEIGSIVREQAKTGGIFKFVTDTNPANATRVAVPANGTMDDVRIYDSSQTPPKTQGYAERYEDYGIWTNEFDLSAFFVPGNDFLDLGNLQFTAYLPMTYSNSVPSTDASKGKLGGGGGSVAVRFKFLKSSGVGTGTASYTEYAPDQWCTIFKDNSTSTMTVNLTDPRTGAPLVVGRNDRLVYEVRIDAARLQNAAAGGSGGTLGGGAYAFAGGNYTVDSDGHAVASPALDDVTLVYFLPTPRILLKERVWD
jgi:hypothetical protein